MSAATKDRTTAITGDGGPAFKAPVAADAILFKGTFCNFNANGYAVPGADTSGHTYGGVVQEYVDNTGGSNGDLFVVLRRGVILEDIPVSSLTIANNGDPVYLVDDQTVAAAATTTNDIQCGIQVGFENGAAKVLSL